MFVWLLLLLAPLSTCHQLRSNTVQHFTSPRCSPDIAEYYNKTLQSCVPCTKCLSGFGRDFHSRITQDEHGEPLTCFPCVPCQDGTHSSTEETCIPCRDCSFLTRNVTSACTSHSDTVCGSCSPGFYDYYRLIEDEDVSKPCRDCRYADTDVQECRTPPDIPAHKQDPAITVSLVVFGVFVFISASILVICLCKWLHRKAEADYRQLVPEENSDSLVSSAQTSSSTTAATDQLRQESLSTSRVSHEDQSGRRVNLPDQNRPNVGETNDPALNGPETNEFNNGCDWQGSCDSGDGIPLAVTRDMPEPSRGGVTTSVLHVGDTSGTRPLLQPPNIDDRGKVTESHHVRAASTVSQMLENVSCRTQSLSEILPLEQQLAEDGESTEDQDVVNVNPAVILPVDENSAAASSCAQLPDRRFLVKSSNDFCRKAPLLRSVSFPLASCEMVPEQLVGGNGSGASAEERIVTSTQLDLVADELGPSYIGRLLRQLRLDHADQKLEDLKDHQYKGRELVYQALLRWKQSCGCQATDNELCSALCNIGRTDVSDRLKRTQSNWQCLV